MLFSKVDYVEVDGVELPIAFNLRALHLGEAESGKSINEIFALMQGGNFAAGFDLIPYFWNALIVGHGIKGKKVEFERSDLDNMDFDTFGRFTEVFTDAVSKMDNSEKKQLKTVRKGKEKA